MEFLPTTEVPGANPANNFRDFFCTTLKPSLPQNTDQAVTKILCGNNFTSNERKGKNKQKNLRQQRATSNRKKNQFIFPKKCNFLYKIQRKLQMKFLRNSRTEIFLIFFLGSQGHLQTTGNAAVVCELVLFRQLKAHRVAWRTPQGALRNEKIGFIDFWIFLSNFNVN